MNNWLWKIIYLVLNLSQVGQHPQILGVYSYKNQQKNKQTDRQLLWQLKVLKLSHRNRECKMVGFSSFHYKSRQSSCAVTSYRVKSICLPDESIQFCMKTIWEAEDIKTSTLVGNARWDNLQAPSFFIIREAHESLWCQMGLKVLLISENEATFI